MLKFFSKENRHIGKVSEEIYIKIVNKARDPKFYIDHKVPDTNDGRFEMITLYAFFVLNRLNDFDDSKYAKKLSQSVFDFMFRDMDRSLRESGVGDLGVPKHMKRMMKGFNGRVHKYKEALENQNGLAEVVANDIYGTVEIDEKTSEKLAEHIVKEYENINKYSLENLDENKFQFLN